MTTPDTSPALVIDDHAQDVLFRSARTAMTFTNEPVTDAQVRDIYELIKWAPTSFNQQPLRITLVRSPEARERLVTHMADGNQPKTRTAPLTALLAADTEFHEYLPTLYPVWPTVRELFDGDPARRESSATLNASLQVGYFLLGVRAAGLAAGPMSGFDTEGVNKEFFPDGRQKVLVVVNIGRPGPDAWGERHPRLTYEQVFSEV